MKAVIPAGSRGTREALSALRRRPDLLLFAPLALAALYLLVLLVQAVDVVRWLYLDGDAASALVIAELVDDAPPERTVYMSNYPWYETLWFMEATRGLPGHRQIWELAPILATLLAFAAVGWSALRTIDRWAGATVFAVLVALGEFARLAFFTPNWHGHTAVHVAIVGVVFVWAVQRAEGLSRWGLVALAVGLGVVTAPGVASDRLTLVAGVAPLVLAAVALPVLLRGRAYVWLAASFVAAAVIALVGGAGLVEVMERDRVEPFDFDVRFVAGTELLLNVQLFLESLGNLAGGDFFGEPFGPYSGTEFLRACIFVLALGVVFVLLRRWVQSARSEPAAVTRDPALTAYTIFWGLALLGPVAAFLLSSVPEDQTGGRYLLSSYIAAAALLPLAALGDGWRRWAVTAGAVVFVAAGAAQLAVKPSPNEAEGYVERGDVEALEEFARSQGLKRGYGDFWTAANVTWASGVDLEVFPVRTCNVDFVYCPHNVHVITTWYQPQEGRSFLLVDRNQQEYVNGPDPLHGAPEEVRTFGQLTAYVYPYDIARRLGPAPEQ
jgi:hypothetical protein